MPRQPEGYHTLNPILRVGDAAAALDFYKSAFGATEDFRREMDGKLLIAVIRIGDSRVMISDRSNDPDKDSGPDTPATSLDLKIYVDDVDAAYGRAIDAGAVAGEAVGAKYWGERTGSLTDPFGFTWRLAQLIEEVPHDEIERRMHAAARE
ncbi:MAG: VOC family protein [Sphingopyxis sp.]|nr:VOC family protein [Sphingopyxis sp.]